MKKLKITNSEDVIFILQDEIRRNPESRYDHRLHAVLLVAQEMSCRQVAQKLGDGARTVAYWASRFEEKGLAGLVDGEKPGRPRRLDKRKLNNIEKILRSSPKHVGITANLWDGKTLSAYIEQKWGIFLSTRQCQRLFRQLGFRFRKPRSEIAHADPEKRNMFKKNSGL